MTAVEIDARASCQGYYREPIVNPGTVHRHGLTWVLHCDVVKLLAKLFAKPHRDRPGQIAILIRGLIGNIGP
jgi:hypothetical protein